MSNSKLYIHKPIQGIPFTFMTYNIDQAVREENFPNTKWNVRMKRVQDLIMDANADVVCLQELRQLPDSYTVMEFLAGIKGYRVEVAYINPSVLSFGLAILYKPEKFFLLSSAKRYLSQTPSVPSDNWGNGFGRIVFGCQLLPVAEEKIITRDNHTIPAIWIFNTHFGLSEQEKTNACNMVVRDILKPLAEEHPFIFAGDFNFFPDRDGPAQRKLLVDQGLSDSAKGATTLCGRPIEGTFIGYEHDEFKQDLSKIFEEGASRLDHVFTSEGRTGLTVDKVPVLYTKTMLDTDSDGGLFTTRDYPSDHLPILMHFSI